MINRVVLVGRITKEVELKMTGTGTSVVNFTLAVNRNYTNQAGERPADFINCVAWRNQADYMNNYVVKGQLLAVEGSIQTRSYEDQTGKNVYVTEVYVDNIQTLERRDSDDSFNDRRQASSAQDELESLSKKADFDDSNNDMPF